jgi:hypothetical protein
MEECGVDSWRMLSIKESTLKPKIELMNKVPENLIQNKN